MTIPRYLTNPSPAGNWKKFESFGWHDAPEDEDNWAIFYTSNRDSGLLEQSNAAFIERTMEPFTEGDDPDVRFERHGHWAVGHVDGLAIRIYDKDGEYTDAYKAWQDIEKQLEDYPVLDEVDYSNREYEATIENIRSAGWGLVRSDAPEDWPSQVFSWFWDNLQAAVENRDDQGGYPSREEMHDALSALGFLDADEED